MKHFLFYSSVLIFLFVKTIGFSQTEVTTERGQRLNVEEYLQKAEQQIQLGDKKEASRYINDLAAAFWEHKNYTRAIELYQQSINLNSEVSNESGIAAIHSNLGMIYADMREYEKSYQHFAASIALRKKLNEKNSLVSTHINISVVLNNMKKYDESAQNLEEALNIAREMNNSELMKSCYGMLSETYEKAGNSEKMLIYFNLYRSFTELVENQNSEKNMEMLREMQLKTQLTEAEKKNKELELLYKNKELQEKEKAYKGINTDYRILLDSFSKKDLVLKIMEKDSKIKDLNLVQEKERLKRNKIIQYVLIGAMVFACIFLIYVYNGYREKKKSNVLLTKQNNEINMQKQQITEQKDKLEESFIEIHKKNENITSSINYAKIIQQAVLTEKDNLKLLVPDSFVFFQPRDIVSGDFYWFSEIGNKIIVAAADCTGHGVPGAFMSMLGHNLLDQITQNFTTDAGLILGELNNEIIKSLHQTNARTAQDGMDIALCVIDKKRKVLQFSGAGNPLIYIQNGQLYQIKGNSFAIGGTVRENKTERNYIKHEIPITTPVYAYIFSDGYSDQFSEITDKKYSIKQLKQLLFENHLKPFDEQEKIINQTINQWMGKSYQIDDMLVIGFKIQL